MTNRGPRRYHVILHPDTSGVQARQRGHHTLTTALDHVIDRWDADNHTHLATVVDNQATEKEPYPRVLLVRMRPQAILVAGAPTLATQVTQAILTYRWSPWRPHPLPYRRTPLPTTESALDSRTYNILRRIGVDTTEEVAAIPPHLLRETRFIGPGTIRTIQRFLR
ncbi:MAG: hypothetical protein M3548_00145 [Actinomycetota bacterium]|nr:hypothetical protein [Actinomycetota bacterium]